MTTISAAQTPAYRLPDLEPKALLDKEWLEPDGSGGFACGCVDGQVRRFWHGLLWVSRKPPTDRVRLVTGMEERLWKEGQANLSLSATCDADGKWHAPDVMPVAFRPRPFATWEWVLPDGRGTLTKSLMMRRFHGTTIVRYELTDASAPVQLALRLILPEEATGAPESGVVTRVEGMTARVACSVPLLPSGRAGAGPLEVEHETEKECEADPLGKLYFAPESVLEIQPGEVVDLVLTAAEDARTQLHMAETARREELTRRDDLDIPCLRQNPLLDDAERNSLAIAADQFIVRRHDGRFTIMAGYPWFTDWGRDTMISLPGLTLATGRMGDARSILDHFLNHVQDGLIPNLFPEAGTEPQFNTIDATLWLFEAVFQYVAQSGDRDFLEHYWDRLRAIIKHHEVGTKQNIHLDADGLIAGGTTGSQLTWMDVKVNGEIPTPRHGKAVEIQGLWFNALHRMGEHEVDMGAPAVLSAHWRLQAERCQTAFSTRFFIGDRMHFADVVDRDGAGQRDDAIRPNMALPFGLPWNIIPNVRRASILRATAKELLTPRGLRSLAPGSSKYAPIYRGDRLARDRAYHNGTVWMWLIAPYLRGVAFEARLVPELTDQVPEIQRGLLDHVFTEGCLGSASEIFDADAPHKPRGCFAQAWSVAAVIEALSYVVTPSREVEMLWR
ncbi:MAG: amylo-alpha-1,6-glucosidase [Sumerlaeia bacterium]